MPKCIIFESTFPTHIFKSHFQITILSSFQKMVNCQSVLSLLSISVLFNYVAFVALSITVLAIIILKNKLNDMKKKRLTESHYRPQLAQSGYFHYEEQRPQPQRQLITSSIAWPKPSTIHRYTRFISCGMIKRKIRKIDVQESIQKFENIRKSIQKDEDVRKYAKIKSFNNKTFKTAFSVY